MRGRLIGALLLTAVWGGGVLLSPGQEAQPPAKTDKSDKTDWTAKLPDGDGKKLVVKLCTRCHTLQSTITKRKTIKEWQATVDDMIGRGAPIFIEEAEQITAYLAKNFPPEKKI